MTNPVPELPTELPAGRLLDPPDELAWIRATRPITRLTHTDGSEGWLATGYDHVRAVLGDTRFSSRPELMHHPLAGKLPAGTPGDIQKTDRPEHTRLRKLLAGKFTPRRTRVPTERVERITADHLDAMERRGPALDLVEAYAWPIPALMICELLTSDLADDELAGVGAFLLGAGLETTANMIGLGTLVLLGNPGQFAELRADPELTDNAVEELLRYLSIAHTALRAALEDVEIDGELIEAGETVTFSIRAANRDPGRYPDPDRLDLRWSTTGQLAFGHGIHQCLGQHLACVELRTAIPALFARFPSLRLAVPAEDVSLRPGAVKGLSGINSLPVTWDA
ncbi:cytochrome P450 [Amycolatopsis taiwanensis]|uniref:Cytochrome P450 n=1 Tax=Amycolatopsis taiwanensis TaxID=342230 RepID=A0A9W6RAC6_9PSEU|nr:cytochrome P450 [Amycolatopsis taiwanensis]GLY71130.1 cytochrome P450 [Amycolatopsis taiwanensis]